MCLVGMMDADGEVGAVESAPGAETEVDSDACDNSTCADDDADVDAWVNAGDCDVADATVLADDAEGTADGAEAGRGRVCRDTAALDRTEFPVRTEVLGDIREDGKSQLLFGWMGQWQRERPKGVVMVRQRSGPEA